MKEKIRCRWANASEELKLYHDNEYGFRIKDDISYFERLTLEIFQAGLSWATILKKREAFRKAFDGFDIYKVARYKQKKIARLLSDSGIIRNKLKINATVYNAGVFIEIINEHGSFDKFMNKQDCENRESILKLFKSRFKFIGPLIIEEFMMSTGFWKVSHEPDCFLFRD